jgi:diguanylate cyclase (GGDEF)-like protein/PAS domain S-box-containing protein
MPLSRLAGIVLLLLGCAVMLGWWLQLSAVVRILPDFAPMVFNTALCFGLAGSALLLPLTSPRSALLRTIAGSLLVGLAGAVLAEHLLQVSLGVDWPSLHAWLLDANPAPGRMSPSTATAFVISGVVLILAGHLRPEWLRTAAPVLTLGVGSIGALGVAGYLVSAQLLFPEYWFTGIAVHTAVGLLLLAVGLWSILWPLGPVRKAVFARDDHRIAFVGAAVLVVTGLGAGIATFSVLQDRVQTLVRDDLLVAHARRVDVFQDMIELREGSARIAATRPAVLRNLRVIRSGRDDGANLANVRAVVDSFLQENFSAIAYHDLDGKVVAKGGRFAETPAISVALATPNKAELLWQQGFLLRHRIPMHDSAGKVGELHAEQPLPVLTRLTDRAPGRGETWDMGVCVRRGEQLICFPQRLTREVFSTPLVNVAGEALPMTRALRGENGTAITRDYRAQNVVAAYGPIGSLGLGMVLKVDAAEVFGPIREQLLLAMGLLALLVAGGTLLLRSQVAPLATRLMDTSAQAQDGLRRAQTMAKLAHVITGPDGSFESWSESLPLLAGLESAGMPRSTREWLKLVHPEDQALFRGIAIEAGVERKRKDVEYRLKRTQGWIHVRQAIEPLDEEAETGGGGRWFSTLQDITEQKTAAEGQRSGKQLLDNIVENIPTAVQLKSVQDGMRIQMWNKAAAAMYGLPSEAAIGRTVHDLWPKADADRMHAADLELAASGEMQDFPDRPAQTKNRGVIHVHMRKVALSDADGKATHLLVVADDMTAQLADQARLRESEERFRSLSMLSSDWFWEQDEEHRFVKFSGGEGVKGWGPDQSKAIGLHRWDLGGVIPISCSWEEHKGLLDAHKPFRSFEYQRILADGRLQYVEASGEPIFDAAGRFTGYRGVATEITQRKEAEHRIRRLNRVYAVLSGINALIVRVRDREELFREACRIAVEAGGFLMAWLGVVDRKAMTVKPVAWHGTDADYIQSMPVGIEGEVLTGRGLAGRAIKERKATVVDDMATDARIALKKESQARGLRSLVILPLLIAEEAVGVLALYAGEIGFFDQEEMKLLQELAGDIAFAIDHIDKASKLDYLAYYDALTGLSNRTHFHESLSQSVEAARRGAHKLAVLVLDIDRFKSINDSLGRDAGDELLRQVAQRLRGVAADPDSLARISADRFVVVRPSVVSEAEVARHNEEKLEKCFGTPYRVAGTELRISARAGIAIFPADGADADSLLTNAEAALKKAKASGERTLFYTQEMTERVAEKLALENKLRQALEKEEFVLHYQPKVDLETRGIVGVEALIRWQSPELGLVPPMSFIPLLEETGLILEVGAWALKRAARDHRGWVEQGLKPPRVAVNVSPIQLRQRDFVEVVKQAIGGGVAEAGIDLEITESLIMENIQENIGKLNAVRALGIDIAIDDFGTGYSSLAYLARLPVKTLKIDRSFIITMLSDSNAMLLVQTMISLAHSLRLKVVAEGVDAEEQANVLRQLRCDEMQGYLFSKPLPLGGITALLRGSRG